MGLLDGQIAAAIYKGFKGKLLSGTLRRSTPGVGVDDFGDANPGTTTEYPFEGIRESYNAVYRAAAGIPQEDVRFLVIAGSLATAPLRGDQVRFGSGPWHQVREIEAIDPATATYNLQCFELRE